MVAGELQPEAVRLQTGEVVTTRPDPVRPLELTAVKPVEQVDEPTPWYGRWYVWAGAAAVTVGVTVGAWVLLSDDGLPETQGGTKSFP